MAELPPIVSVVIPVFNGERFLGEAIGSVLDQQYVPLEVIVVDDASRDGSAALAESYGVRVRVLRLPGNVGPAAARNAGVSASRGAVLAFLDADDRMATGRLRRDVGYLVAHPDVAVLLGRQEIVLEPGQTIPPWMTNPATGEPISVVPTSAMIRRAAFELIGGFDVTYRAGEGMNLLHRCRAARLRVEVRPEIVLLRRVHETNVSHAIAGGDLRRAYARSLREQIERRRYGSEDAQ